MPLITSTTRAGWLNLDAWSETYVGAHWLVTNKLPHEQYQAEPVDGPLSQMVLIASHQLVEIMLFRCIRRNLETAGKWSDVVEQMWTRIGFAEAFNKWILCRHRHKIHYANFRIMPTPEPRCLQQAVNGLARST